MMRDELKDRAISLLKDTYAIGYEDGLKDRHDRYEEICQGLWREVEEWESRIDAIKADIDKQTEIHSDGEFYIKNIDVKRIIDKHCGGDNE